MADDLEFFTNPYSRGRVVRWMLEEVGASYQTTIVQYGEEMQGAAYRAINPMAKVPAIRHRGVVVTETSAICCYLADAFPAAGLAPALDDPQRGAYLRWLFFVAGPVESAAFDIAIAHDLPDDKRAMSGYGSRERVIETLAAQLSSGPFLLGERLSTTDIYLGALMEWYLAFGIFPSLPEFTSYVARLSDRPAARRARAIDDALMPPQQPASH